MCQTELQGACLALAARVNPRFCVPEVRGLCGLCWGRWGRRLGGKLDRAWTKKWVDWNLCLQRAPGRGWCEQKCGCWNDGADPRVDRGLRDGPGSPGSGHDPRLASPSLWLPKFLTTATGPRDPGKQPFGAPSRTPVPLGGCGQVPGRLFWNSGGSGISTFLCGCEPLAQGDHWSPDGPGTQRVRPRLHSSLPSRSGGRPRSLSEPGQAGSQPLPVVPSSPGLPSPGGARAGPGDAIVTSSPAASVSKQVLPGFIFSSGWGWTLTLKQARQWQPQAVCGHLGPERPRQQECRSPREASPPFTLGGPDSGPRSRGR
ncbi:collagen alpha-2(I) chain-like [Nomascus leucogenys]|uniref:collagen alpha-2(I) chain-like n=1 Tax=Nomascus leucogenys TaxID=61853 RepID=UPI00122DC0B9|nr:collagen alpha-2(I) chain-like [Nomascus leucogenys]